MFLAGATCWRLFENSLIWATRSLELNRKLLSKVYIPRLLLPFASLVPAFVELGFYVGFLAAAIAIYSAVDGALYLNLDLALLAVPAALGLALLFAMGIGLYTAVLGATARDVRFSLTYVLGFWYMLTPVIYPLSQVPANFRWVAELNPMTPVVELFKWGLLDAGQVRPVGLAVAGTVIALLWAGGLWFFARAEADAVDRL
jgi:lipopolysaccharide transport system permease protein